MRKKEKYSNKDYVNALKRLTLGRFFAIIYIPMEMK